MLCIKLKLIPKYINSDIKYMVKSDEQTEKNSSRVDADL